MDGEVFTPRPPEVGFARAGLNPPAAYYVNENATLVIDTWSSTAPAALTITAEVLTADGQITLSSWSHTPNTNRTRATSRFPLIEGFLLSVIVDATGLAYRRGHTWCMVSIQRGEAATGVAEAVLIADYITDTRRLAWPVDVLSRPTDGLGLISSVAGSDPAAGAEWSITVPAGARWRVLGVIATLTTSATVASRIATLVVDDGTNWLYNSAAQTAQGASQYVVYCWGAALPSAATAGGVSNNPLPTGLDLAPGYRLRSSTANLQVGDDWSAPRALVQEWVEP